MSVDLVDLGVLTAGIVVGMLLSVAYYESLSQRDSVVVLADRIGRRRHWDAWMRRIGWLCAVLIVTPILVVVWTGVLYVALYILVPVDRLSQMVIVAPAIVAATRILAYTAPAAAHELAKLVPIAILVLLIAGANLDAAAFAAKDDEMARLLDVDDALVVPTLVLLELVLRAGSEAIRRVRE